MQSRPHPPEARPLGDRERFLAFAFAAADLLVEADLDGEVTFAAGAFRMRFGHAPEAMLGRSAMELIAPEDRAAFASALGLLPSRGRLPSTFVRLANSERSRLVASGLHLALPGLPERLCLAFATAPATLGPDEGAARPAATLIRDAEARLRASAEGAAPSQLGMIEIAGSLPRDMLAQLAAALAASRPGGLEAAELAPGRFGLLSRGGAELPSREEILRKAGALLPEQGAGHCIRQMEISLGLEGLDRLQAVRALRHGLAVFARAGVGGLSDAGFEGGLRGFVAQVGRHTRQLAFAVRERRFHLDYQPIFDLRTGVLHHYEALLRPARGMLSEGAGPAEFVGLAEAVGLTEELDLAVLDAALAALPQLNGGERIAINLSGLSVQSDAFRMELMTRIAASPLAPSRLMVELTETAEIEREEPAAETLAALRALAIPVCLDDFGAGAAAFRYLKAFAVDFVKVDGAFVQAALDSERDRSFVSSMVDLSLAVGAKVIAERIETPAHAELMRGLGVEYGQGWHLGRPGPLRKAGVGAAQGVRRGAAAAGRRGGAKEQWG